MSWGSQPTPLPSALQALKAAGVTEVILAINYRPEVRWCAAEGPILPPTADCAASAIQGDGRAWYAAASARSFALHHPRALPGRCWAQNLIPPSTPLQQ